MLFGLRDEPLEALRAWTRDTWYRIAHNGDSHLGAAGTQVDPIHSVGGSMHYFTKYLAKGDQTMPGNFSGRYWGKINAKRASAALLLDPDSDSQNNLFEFTTGVIPTSATSRFVLTITAVSGQPLQKASSSAPASTTVSMSSKPAPPCWLPVWSTLSTTTTSDTGLQPTVTDTTATGTHKLYRVEITKP